MPINDNSRWQRIPACLCWAASSPLCVTADGRALTCSRLELTLWFWAKLSTWVWWTFPRSSPCCSPRRRMRTTSSVRPWTTPWAATTWPCSPSSSLRRATGGPSMLAVGGGCRSPPCALLPLWDIWGAWSYCWSTVQRWAGDEESILFSDEGRWGVFIESGCGGWQVRDAGGCNAAWVSYLIIKFVFCCQTSHKHFAHCSCTHYSFKWGTRNGGWYHLFTKTAIMNSYTLYYIYPHCTPYLPI